MKKILLSLSLLSVPLVIGALFLFLTSKEALPTEIKNKLNFSALYPQGKPAGFSVDNQSLKVTPDPNDNSSNIFTFIMKKNSTQITITEQAYPEILIYDKFTAVLNPYGEIQTKVGKVYLTHPKELNGGQTAVTNANNLLFFAKPNAALSNADWQTIFNSLQTAQ